MTIRIAIAALAIGAASALPAQALTLDQVSIVTTTQIDVASDLAYDPLAEALDFTGVVTGTTPDLTAAGLSDIVGLALVDGAGAPVLDSLIDDILVFDGIAGLVLVGQIADIAFGSETSGGSGIEILFATVANTLDPLFDGFFAATITGFAGADAIAVPGSLPDATMGGTPLSALTALNPVTSSAVPLPAGLPLLLSALGGLGLLRLRRAI